METSLRKATIKSMIGNAIDEIFSVQPCIDRIAFSGNYKRGDLEAVFGKLKEDEKYVPEKRMPAYDKKLIRDMKGFLLIFFVKPNKARPLVYLEVFPKENCQISDWQNLLKKLSAAFPKLIVSGIEYAIDLFCTNKGNTGLLFWVLMRYLYIPSISRKGKVYFFCEKGNEKEINTLQGADYKVNFVHRIGRDIRVYERGSDRDKKKGAWLRENLDRIRLEKCIRRNRLIKYGIHRPNHVLESPKFLEVNERVWRFKTFAHSRKLPKEWEDYQTKDSKGNSGILMLEILNKRKEVKNILQCLKDQEDLRIGLRGKILEGLKKYDEEWISERKNIDGK
jgi:hypothetical protein